jgi:hypothetical protein
MNKLNLDFMLLLLLVPLILRKLLSITLFFTTAALFLLHPMKHGHRHGHVDTEVTPRCHVSGRHWHMSDTGTRLIRSQTLTHWHRCNDMCQCHAVSDTRICLIKWVFVLHRLHTLHCLMLIMFYRSSDAHKLSIEKSKYLGGSYCTFIIMFDIDWQYRYFYAIHDLVLRFGLC